jgi:Sulfotransferase family
MRGWTAAAYGVTAARVARRGLRAGQRVPSARTEERLAFVLGSPRSGTTFTGRALGSLPGWVDLGEVPLLKAAVPELVDDPVDEQAHAVRRIIERVRALGLVRGLRGVEQNPETAWVLAGALRAYPQATAVHVIRDGRDVVCSLLERGWLGGRTGTDDANQPFGSYARFWVEPERRGEFERASEAKRAAWAWRRYVTVTRSVPERTVELRYEALVADPLAEANRLAGALRTPAEPLRAAFSEVHDESLGRWRRDLTPEQLRDVEAEAGELLADLGYA